jgi:hypothetical protein
MKRSLVLSASPWYVLAAVLMLSACPNGGEDDPRLVESVTLDTEITLVRGKTAQLTATVEPPDAENKTLSWASSDSDVAAVDGSGLVTAVKEGTATVSVTTKDGSNKTANCKVTVTSPVESITLNSASLELAVNGTFLLSAVVAPDKATDKSIKWSVDSGETVTLSSTTESSITVTANAVGAAKITATANDGSGTTAECTVTVKPGAGFVIKPPDFGDKSIALSPDSIPDLSRRDYDNVTVRVSGSYTSIKWYVDGTQWGSGDTTYIYARDLSVSTHFLTVVVEINDGANPSKYFSKELSFRVVE